MPVIVCKGDLVWRMASNTRKKDGKFFANWEYAMTHEATVTTLNN